VWIVPCLEGDAQTHWSGSSIYPAVQNMLLAARALGLGATLTTLHLVFEKEAEAALGLPPNVHSYALLPIGYPMGRFGLVPRCGSQAVKLPMGICFRMTSDSRHCCHPLNSPAWSAAMPVWCVLAPSRDPRPLNCLEVLSCIVNSPPGRGPDPRRLGAPRPAPTGPPLSDDSENRNLRSRAVRGRADRSVRNPL